MAFTELKPVRDHQTIMVLRQFASRWAPVTVQVLGAVLLAPIIALAPSGNGNLLLVPLAPQRSTAARAVAEGALIVGRGRYGDSLVVRGRYASLAWPLLRQGVLTLGAPSLLCGGEVAP